MSTQHARTAIATGSCLTFGLAVAVAVGAVPQHSSDEPVPVSHAVVAADPELARLLLNPADVLEPDHAAAPVRRVMSAATHTHRHAAVVSHPHHVHAARHGRSHPTRSLASDPVSSVTVEPVAAQGATTETANLKHAAPHKKHHHKKKHHKKSHKPAAPVPAERTTPSASALSSAISGLRNFVHTPFTPTSAQVAQFGDQVCSAFDDNQTFAHVKAVILQKVKQLPFTTVTAGAADYVVKTAVKLYCPGYKSKVS